MLLNKIKKIFPRKILFYPISLLFIIMITLAFIPHYSCACGDEGNNKKANGSKLGHYSIKIAENIAKVIYEVIN